MANDLRIVKEWSPYYALDPDADFAFTGDPGQGQMMRWVSEVRRVGSGTMSIVRSTPNESVETILELGERATLNTRLDFARAPNGSVATWSVSAQCATGAVNVPCRYMNLIMRRMVEQDLDNGLERLKTLSEQLPNVDFEGLAPDQVQVAAQPYVYVPVTASYEDEGQVDAALNSALAQVDTFMTDNNLVRTGAQIRVTTEWDGAQQRMSFRVGYPFSGPTPLTVVGVQIGETPSGSAMHVTHEGARTAMRSTYERLYAYLQAHRTPIRAEGLPWEVVLDEGAPDGSRPMRAEIFVPLQ
jgi:effector-binding domain-containing protein